MRPACTRPALTARIARRSIRASAVHPLPAYTSILLLQLKVVWGMWWLRDLTTGDTASYFVDAHDWHVHGRLNLASSPLYTVCFPEGGPDARRSARDPGYTFEAFGYLGGPGRTCRSLDYYALRGAPEGSTTWWALLGARGANVFYASEAVTADLAMQPVLAGAGAAG